MVTFERKLLLSDGSKTNNNKTYSLYFNEFCAVFTRLQDIVLENMTDIEKEQNHTIEMVLDYDKRHVTAITPKGNTFTAS